MSAREANHRQAQSIHRYYRHLLRTGNVTLEEAARLWIIRYAGSWRTRATASGTKARARSQFTN